MLSILTGLPIDKKNDGLLVRKFVGTDATKVICGSSTMKMFCRVQNINPEIALSFENKIPVAKYKIKNIHLATEGIITLNECYKCLIGGKTENSDAASLGQLLVCSEVINFFIGTAQNKDSINYKRFDFLPRKQIIEKIIVCLEQKHKIVNIFML